MTADEAIDIIATLVPKDRPRVRRMMKTTCYNPIRERSMTIAEEAQWLIDHEYSIGGHRLSLEEAKQNIIATRRADFHERLRRYRQIQKAFQLLCEAIRQ